MNRVTLRDLKTLLEKIDELKALKPPDLKFFHALGAVEGQASIVHADLVSYERIYIPSKHCSAVEGSYPESQTCGKIAQEGFDMCPEHLQEEEHA